MKFQALRYVMLIMVTGIAGCGQPLDTRFVAQRWAETLTAYNIDPVFPPRFVQPGDVFLFSEPPDAESTDRDRYRRRAIRLGRAEIRRALMDDAQAGLQLPRTGGPATGFNIFNVPRTIQALTPTAYPGFNIAQFTQADLGVAFPLQALRAVLGLSGSREIVAAISIPNAENIELPAIAAHRAMRAFCGVDSEASPCHLRHAAVQQSLADMRRPGDPPSMVPRIAFVTSVYYARQIKYAYSRQAGAAFAASVGTALGNSSSNTAPTASREGTVDAAAEARATLAELRRQIETNNARFGSEGVGGTINIASVGAEGSVLEQTFDRPVAIGFRAMWLYPYGYHPPVTAMATPRQ